MSVLAARPQVSAGGIVLCDGDVVLEGDALHRLVSDAAACGLLLDRETRLGEEEMKALVDDRGALRRLSKQVNPAEAAGESIGVQKVSGPALQILWATLDAMREASDTSGYYEDAFQRMLQAGVTFHTVLIGHHEWTEIDDLADLETPGNLPGDLPEVPARTPGLQPPKSRAGERIPAPPHARVVDLQVTPRSPQPGHPHRGFHRGRGRYAGL
jgi:choline kinase